MNQYEQTDLFDADKKTQWMVFFRELGFERDEIVWLEKELGYSTDTIPKAYLDKSSAIITDTYGEHIAKMSWLIDTYTPFPYGREYSAKIIYEALEQAKRQYPDTTIPLRYTTMRDPSTVEFRELLAENYIGQANQGRLDLVGAVGFLRNHEVMNSNYLNILRANNEYIEFELVFGYDAVRAGQLMTMLDDTSMSITYNKTDRLLTIDQHIVPFRSGLQADLCSTLFTGRKLDKEWASDEIFSSWGLHEDEHKHQNRLVIYQTGKKINDAVAKETSGKVTDLIKYTTKSASINSKYRKFVSKC